MLKALSLWQPWASLVALGVKTIETRSWSTSYRGPLAIHATKTQDFIGIDCDRRLGDVARPIRKALGEHDHVPHPDFATWQFSDDEKGLPLGAIVATCTLVDVVPMVAITDERASGAMLDVLDDRLLLWRSALEPEDVTDQLPYGIYEPGRYAWLLADIKPLAEPIPARGRQGLWNWQEAA